jgi:hypothetical protein
MENPAKSLTLSCCGGQKCPVASLREDGGVTLEDTVAGRTDTIVLSKEQIEKRIQRHIDAMTPGLAIQLRRIFNSLKESMSQPSDWFEMAPAATAMPKSKRFGWVLARISLP